MKKAAGYVIKRTITYSNGQTVVDWVKSVGLTVTLSNREQAKVYPRKKDAQAVVSQIRRSIRSEYWDIEPVTE